jgi:GxxExxY protein
MLENVYKECLYYRLLKLSLEVEKEKGILVTFEEIKMDCGYRADLVVERKLIVEVKSVEGIADVHLAQVLTYLKFANCRLGLLIDFNVSLLKMGIRRIANNL